MFCFVFVLGVFHSSCFFFFSSIPSVSLMQDPLLCFASPMWSQLLEDATVTPRNLLLVVFVSPETVVRQLATLGLPTEMALAVWETCYEAAVSNFPEGRGKAAVFFHFDPASFLTDHRCLLKQLNLRSQSRSLLRPSLRRVRALLAHHFGEEQVEWGGLDVSLSDSQQKLWWTLLDRRVTKHCTK